MAQHHQAQGAPAGCRRLEGPDGQAAGVDPLNGAVESLTEAVADSGAVQPAEPIETDAVVIGAGPVGLFQVFELGLLGIRAEVVDSLPAVGGQCALLYADKPIFDIPGTPRCTGRELIDRLQQQIGPFATRFHLDRVVDTIERQSDGRFWVGTSTAERFLARVVVIAGGVGSFQPRRLKAEGLARFERHQVFYDFDNAAPFNGRRVLVVGDGEEALQTAIALSQPGAAASVTLMHRRDEFKAAPETLARIAALRQRGSLAFVAAQPVVAVIDGDDRLAGLEVALPDGSKRTLPLDAIIALTGLSPKLGPIANWGLAMARKQVVVDTATFETDVPGIFAVGDINTYPGKKKLIVCGFHEATLAAYGAAARLFPGTPMPLEYTTTSPRLRSLLGE